METESRNRNDTTMHMKEPRKYTESRTHNATIHLPFNNQPIVSKEEATEEDHRPQGMECHGGVLWQASFWKMRSSRVVCARGTKCMMITHTQHVNESGKSKKDLFGELKRPQD